MCPDLPSEVLFLCFYSPNLLLTSQLDNLIHDQQGLTLRGFRGGSPITKNRVFRGVKLDRV